MMMSRSILCIAFFAALLVVSTKADNESVAQWNKLWDSVKNRLEGQGYDARGLEQPAQTTESHLRRVLDGMDPYGPAPTDCDPEDDVELILWNADKDKMLGPMKKKVDICKYKMGLSIEVVPPCKEKVKFKLLDEAGEIVYKNTEGLAPMTMGGDEEMPDGTIDILPVPELSVPGYYTLEINPVPGERVAYPLYVVGC